MKNAAAVDGRSSRAATTVAGDPRVEIVIPVYNEERDLEWSVRRLRAYLDGRFPYPARITIADNASEDRTPMVGGALAAALPEVRYLRLEEKGRGRALAAAWLSSPAPVVAYMDVDLSTGLDALLPLIEPLVTGRSDVAIGSRLAPESRVRRGARRELISRSYNLLLRRVLRVRFTDAQCGFKAVRTDVARRLVPEVENRAWFFDTELLVLAERARLRILEVPVEWTDDPDSRVRIAATILEDLRGVWRLRRAGRRRHAGCPETEASPRSAGSGEPDGSGPRHTLSPGYGYQHGAGEREVAVGQPPASDPGRTSLSPISPQP